VARLRGSVASAAEHGAVVEIARDTDGVREVVDQLQIDGRSATSEHAASF
jgi:osmotically-inducible protein OsmY